MPSVNGNRFHTLTVNENAVENFLAKGATLGACDDNCAVVRYGTTMTLAL